MFQASPSPHPRDHQVLRAVPGSQPASSFPVQGLDAGRAEAHAARARRRWEEQQRVDKLVKAAQQSGYDGGLSAGFRSGCYWGLILGAALCGGAIALIGAFA